MEKSRLRRGQILHLLEKNGAMSCKELAAWLDVSEMTIRRDLNNLQEGKAIVRGAKVGTFALAGPNIHAKEDYDVKIALDRDMAEKERIGRFAASLVMPDDAIIIDNGSTASRMVPHISADIKFTALCNSIDTFVKRFFP